MYEPYIKKKINIAFFDGEDVIVTSGLKQDENSMGVGEDNFGF